MKRLAKPRLKNAKSAGWHGEFPIELWSILITFMPLTTHQTLDLDLVLRLLRVCRGMVDALRECILGYLTMILDHRETWDEVYARSPSERVASMTWSLIKELQYEKPTSPIERYIHFCLLDRRYQTVEHLSNVISLMHYAYLQGVYVRQKSSYSGRYLWPFYVFREMHDRDNLDSMFYYQPNNNKAVLVYRMAEVSVLRDMTFERITKLAKKSLVTRGHDRYDARRIVHRIVKENTTPHSFAALFEIIEEGEKTWDLSRRTLQTSKARVADRFGDIVITYEGNRYPIFSPVLEDFRARCFVLSNKTCLQATYIYRLLKSYETHCHMIRESDRFVVSPDETLQSTCKSIHSIMCH